jgi:hypothetical protein
VGLGGLEPPASSLSAKCREPLCGPPFPQVALDRKGQSYAFNRLSGMRSYNPRSRSLRRSLIAGLSLASSRPALLFTTFYLSIHAATMLLQRLQRHLPTQGSVVL